jgi:hypothetical protein
MGLSLMPCSHSRPLICSGNQRIWRNFASILRRNGAISLRGLLRIACLPEQRLSLHPQHEVLDAFRWRQFVLSIPNAAA